MFFMQIITNLVHLYYLYMVNQYLNGEIMEGSAPKPLIWQTHTLNTLYLHFTETGAVLSLENV